MQTSHQACLILPGRFVPQFFLEVERRAPVVSRRLETKRAESHLFLTDHQRTARGEVTFMEIRKMRGSGWSPDRLKWLTVLCMSSGIEPNQLQQPVCHEQIQHDGLMVNQEGVAFV